MCSDINLFRQGQRFVLTSPISTDITKVNGKRWPRDVTTLLTFVASQITLSRESGAYER